MKAIKYLLSDEFFKLILIKVFGASYLASSDASTNFSSTNSISTEAPVIFDDDLGYFRDRVNPLTQSSIPDADATGLYHKFDDINQIY